MDRKWRYNEPTRLANTRPRCIICKDTCGNFKLFIFGGKIWCFFKRPGDISTFFAASKSVIIHWTPSVIVAIRTLKLTEWIFVFAPKPKMYSGDRVAKLSAYFHPGCSVRPSPSRQGGEVETARHPPGQTISDLYIVAQ